MPETKNGKAILRNLFAHVMRELDISRVLDRIRPRIDGHIESGGRLPTRLIAFGKAAVPMSEWLLGEYGPGVVQGVLCAPDSPSREWPGIRCFRGGHPVPNQDSLRAGRAALEMAHAAGEGDLVVFLISGGGSALFESPLRPLIGLDDLRRLNHVLVTCGADIVEINVVRKHVSAVKGGRLAEAAYPARQLTLYISDVPDGYASSVASGPTMPDESTLDDLRGVISTHGLEDKLPAALGSLLGDPALPETPKPGEVCFSNSKWICVLENRHAIDEAVRFAEDKGWRTVVDSSVDDADVGAAAEYLLERLRRLGDSVSNGPVCVVSGGELSSPVWGDGTGGRNQAFVLDCVRRVSGERITVLSAGTDGIDGNSPAAGAVADGSTVDRARSHGMDPAEYYARSDSYSFFKRLGDDITCGATRNNVRDIRVLVLWR
ncbi:MAG: DUF4147 domain-containing protein [bacterium]